MLGAIRYQAVDRSFCIRGRFGGHFWTVSDTFGEDHVHVGDPDEAQEHVQVWGDKVSWAIFMNAAAAAQDDSAFTGDQTFWTFFGVTEGHASAGNQIEVVFQLRWDVEVIHRRGDDNHVVGLQFSNQLVRELQRFLLTWGQWRIAWAQRADQFAIQHRDWIGSQVADGDFVSGVLFTPLFNKIVGQLT